MDKIIIRDLEARCTLGVTEEERRAEQEVLLTLVLHADVRLAAEADALGAAVDYRAVKKRVLAYVEASRFHLLEALADAVARVCLEFSGVLRVDVSIDKPGALRFARSVAVELSRGREER